MTIQNIADRESLEDNCLLGIAEDDANEEDVLGGWTFGQLFLRAHYCVFDRYVLY